MNRLERAAFNVLAARDDGTLNDTLNELEDALNASINACVPEYNADARSIGLDWCMKHKSKWDLSNKTCDNV